MDADPPPVTHLAQDLFFAGRFLRWTLAGVVLVTLVALGGLPPETTTVATVARMVVEGALALLFLAVILPHHFAWAGRILCALVFLTFLLYFGTELWEDPGGLFRVGQRSESNAFNALLGTLVIGLPSLTYALRGPRFDEPEEDLLEDEDFDNDEFVPDEEPPTPESVGW